MEPPIGIPECVFSVWFYHTIVGGPCFCQCPCPKHCLLHPHGEKQGKQHLFCTSIFVKPANFHPAESYLPRILKGCPNLTVAGVTKYLNPSPATAKEHMRRPRIGIQSTRQVITLTHRAAPLLPTDAPNLEILLTDSLSVESLRPSNANLIESNDNSTDANIFCFAAFTDKQTGVLYNNLMGPFPFMSLKGNICFLIVYHYKTNAILALPIKGFSNHIIFAANKQQFNLLESKGCTI
jgi:hypothetical protein